MQTEEALSLTKEEFLAFCLAYASECDDVVLQDEEDHIRSLVGELAAEKAYSLLHGRDDYQRLEIIASYRDQFYPTPEDKGRLLGQMEEVFMSDNFYHPIEKTTLNILKDIL